VSSLGLAEQGDVHGAGAPPRPVLLLTTAALLIFVQAFMVAPILPRLAQLFGTGVGFVGLSIPAYLIPYGLTSLVWGPIADRLGRRPVILACLAMFVVVTAATATAPTAGWFIFWRILAGVVASGIVPVSVALIADVVPYWRRGHALGWIFGGMAGGMAAGSTAGALLEPVIGWRGLFLGVALASFTAFGVLVARTPRTARPEARPNLRAVMAGYRMLLGNRRARRTYAYVAMNALVQSGIYAWLGLYLHRRFGLGPVGIGLTLLGYGVPGLVLGPAIGRAADRYGRAVLIPIGVTVSAVAAFALAAPLPLVATAVAVAVLSSGYDLTQPLLAGIVTDLPGPAGQAVALMAVILFSGFGLGALAFQAALTVGFTFALVTFGVFATLAAMVAVPAFTTEGASPGQRR
jgi:predicted MFS family arabinose efflux permease